MNRSKVVVYQIASVDGKLAISPEHRMGEDERWDQFMSSNEVMDRIKEIYEPEAFLEGSGSLIPEDYIPEPLDPFEGEKDKL